VSAPWTQLYQTLVDALAPYPEARAAVVERLTLLEAEDASPEELKELEQIIARARKLKQKGTREGE